MVDRITMDKGVALGYGNLDDLELVGRAFGYDIYVETVESTAIVVWVYDRNVTKRMRRGNWLDDCPNTMETRYRIPAKVCLSKERGAWHVDLLSVDSRYKGNNLAIKIYKFLMRKMDITLMAGHSASLLVDGMSGTSCPRHPALWSMPRSHPIPRYLTSPRQGNVSWSARCSTCMTAMQKYSLLRAKLAIDNII
jgi:hypothetical protein